MQRLLEEESSEGSMYRFGSLLKELIADKEVKESCTLLGGVEVEERGSISGWFGD